MKKYIILSALLFGLLPSVVFAINLNLDYPEFGGFNLNDNQELYKIVAFFYYFIIGIAGLAAFVMLVWGGVEWLVSGAIPARASEARDRVRNAILGLLLVLASFLIIQIINPELTILSIGNPNVVGIGGGTFGSVSLALSPNFVAPSGAANATINWAAQGFTDCDADEVEVELVLGMPQPPPVGWNGAQPLSGMRSLGPFDTEGIYVFTIFCTGGGVPATAVNNALATLIVSPSPATADVPATTLTANGFAGSVSAPAGSTANFVWSSTNAGHCHTHGALGLGLFRLTSGTQSSILSSTPGETHTYSVTCVNESSGRTNTATVTVTTQ